MKKTPLKVKTPLKAKTQLKTTATLKTKKPLKAKISLNKNSSICLHSYHTLSDNKLLYEKKGLQSKNGLQSFQSLKQKQISAKKLETPYYSVFSNDLTICYITKKKSKNVVPHHIFGGANKILSEKYGFILPLRKDWHTISSYSIHEDIDLDIKYKRLCQDYYINVLKKSKDNFIKEFGKWY